MRESEIEDLIGRFYEAAADPAQWRDVLGQASHVFEAQGSVLLGPISREMPVIWSTGLDEMSDDFVKGGWYLMNPRPERAMKAGVTKIHTESTLFTQEELDRHFYLAEFWNRYGLRYWVGTLLTEPGPDAVAFSCERSRTSEPFSTREIETFARALPHLKRAASLASKLANARSEGVVDGLEAAGCAAFLLSETGEVLRWNHAAQIHLGDALHIRAGRLEAKHPAAQEPLAALIASVLSKGVHTQPVCGPIALPRREGRPLVLEAAPLVRAAWDIFRGSQAIVLLRDPDQGIDPTEALLRQAFGLTPAEARLARGLAGGADLGRYADQAGLQMGTVRVQLKRVFSKTGVQRQADLVRLLARMGR
jgi:DNA-binding CsgD family transcriptional regulator/PAS domain-containing protein